MLNKIEKLHEEAINKIEYGIDAERIDVWNENEAIQQSAEITKDIAIKFSLWQQQGDCEWILNDEDEWYIPYNPHVRINTEQLFNIFIETL